MQAIGTLALTCAAVSLLRHEDGADARPTRPSCRCTPGDRHCLSGLERKALCQSAPFNTTLAFQRCGSRFVQLQVCEVNPEINTEQALSAWSSELCPALERVVKIRTLHGGPVLLHTQRICLHRTRQSDDCSVSQLRYQRSCDERLPSECPWRPAYSCQDQRRDTLGVTHSVLVCGSVSCTATRCGRPP